MTQPVPRKKFHLPHGAHQGKRGTKGDRAQYGILYIYTPYFSIDNARVIYTKKV